jgi:trans-aconitate 2-methyltransferase
MTTDAWDPQQYRKFQEERAQPFRELLALVHPVPGGQVVDLGCGTGELTKELHERLGAVETLGIDSSASMLASASPLSKDGLRFEQGDIATFRKAGWDVVFSNAALQWLPDHPALFRQLASMVRPGGQLAVQMPANHDHLSYLVASEVASEEPFRTALGGYVRCSPLLSPEAYASLLYDLGFRDQHVRLQVFGHVLASRDGVVEWVKGTLLTDYQQRLPDGLFTPFLARYRERLAEALPDARPFFYPFKRLLLWGRRAG